jgi:hypothetical protein
MLILGIILAVSGFASLILGIVKNLLSWIIISLMLKQALELLNLIITLINIQTVKFTPLIPISTIISRNTKTVSLNLKTE